MAFYGKASDHFISPPIRPMKDQFDNSVRTLDEGTCYCTRKSIKYSVMEYFRIDFRKKLDLNLYRSTK